MCAVLSVSGAEQRVHVHPSRANIFNRRLFQTSFGGRFLGIFIHPFAVNPCLAQPNRTMPCLSLPILTRPNRVKLYGLKISAVVPLPRQTEPYHTKAYLAVPCHAMPDRVIYGILPRKPVHQASTIIADLMQKRPYPIERPSANPASCPASRRTASISGLLTIVLSQSR